MVQCTKRVKFQRFYVTVLPFFCRSKMLLSREKWCTKTITADGALHHTARPYADICNRYIQHMYAGAPLAAAQLS